MTPAPSQALTVTANADDRVRRALERLDVLARDRVSLATTEAGEAAVDVVEEAAARVEERMRAAVGRSAWTLLAIAVGVGVVIGAASARR